MRILVSPSPPQRYVSPLCRISSDKERQKLNYRTKGIDYNWCRSPDIGLPAPDLVLFLDLSPEIAKLRGGYGEERYESTQIQLAVRKIFATVGQDVGATWKSIDAGDTEQVVKGRVTELALKAIAEIKGPVGKLWQG